MSSQMLIEDESTVVELIKPHVETQLELCLYVIPEEQAAH